MKALTLIPVLALAACAASLPAPNPTGTSTAGFGQTATVGSLKVTPVALVEDSRCPANVQCVWAGRLVVKADIRGGRWHEVRDLSLGSPQDIADGKISLVSGVPDKVAGQPTELADYRFTFDFSGGF